MLSHAIGTCRHIKNRAQRAESLKLRQLFAAPKHAPPVALAPAELNARTERRINVRALLHANMRACGMNPHLIQSVLGPDSPCVGVLKQLQDAGVTICTERTIRDDLPKAYKLLQDVNIAEIKNTFGSITVDGATFSKEKVFAILYQSPALDYNVLLKLVTPSNNPAGEEWVDGEVPVSMHSTVTLCVSGFRTSVALLAFSSVQCERGSVPTCSARSPSPMR